jgi:hypothetical protein
MLVFPMPDCGVGDFELGYLADDQDVYCEVCLEENRRLVRPHRWLPTEQPHHARFRIGLAA